jgi:hypothetical protein
MIVLDARHAHYPSDRFLDGVHLNAEGAKQLSQDVAEFLRHPGVLDRSRPVWASLPGSPDSMAAKTRQGPGEARR